MRAGARRHGAWVLAAAAALGLGACMLPGAREVAVRPIRVRVVDAATKQPLAGVAVSYALEAMVMREVLRLFSMPIEPDVGPRIVRKARGVTDANGEVELAAGKVRLKRNERLYRDLVLVNLGVDMGARSAATALDAERAGCARSPETCAATPPDDVDVALRMIAGFEEDRAAVFRNPDGRHRGVVVVTERADAGREGFKDWTTPGDRFHVRFEFARLTGEPEALVVELEPGAPSP